MSNDTSNMLQSGQLCEWFARCVRPAARTCSHPILGEVPICEECHGKYLRLGR